MSFRVRIYSILSVLVIISLLGGLIMIWYTYRMEDLFSHIIDDNLAGYKGVVGLEEALINQKGFLSYYLLDGDPDWLKQLGEYRQIFKERLNKVGSLVETDEEKETLNLIKTEYFQYILSKDKVIACYKVGKRKEGYKIHRQVRHQFFEILGLSGKFKNLYNLRIQEITNKNRSQANQIRVITIIVILIVLCMALLLAFVLIQQILMPLRRLALETDRDGEAPQSGNEVKALNRSVRGLLEAVDHSHSELEKSRETLLHAEKMALVGTLAAGMAHSIRNPLTSVKMRLFSLDRTLDLSEHQKDDFNVISDEIRHVDTIVENFLNFSRPPKLKIQMISPSDVVDLAIRLLQHRLESYNVDIKVERQQKLNKIQADPEQLREAVVNLVVNACEEMEEGGSIIIREEERFAEPLGWVAVIRLSDNGPGIPQSVQDKVFQPFFTTKEQGTGLGLSITARIIEEHGGWLDLRSKEGEGATFIISLPVTGPENKL
ncbi:MAG: histidine kinase [Desulfobacteraceae bacterium 4484_190.1]|nr:MAG: histidine kinase [Desulfobacteraceae bacterium 4484_190.1]